MESKSLTGTGPRTDVEYEAEADRLAAEIRAMLDDARRSTEQTRRIMQRSERTLKALEKQLSCGKN